MIGATGRGYFDSAYNLYIPIYSLSMAGLPVAASRLISQQVATGHFKDVKSTVRVMRKLFFITGIIGLSFILILAYPYATVAKTKEVIPVIFGIAPSIIFCTMMSTYRGYYNGLKDRVPTSVSQVVEAVFKTIIGLFAARFTLSYGLERFSKGLTVFGKSVSTKSEALSAIYPYAGMAAAIGVTVGALAGLVYMLILYRIKGDGIEPRELACSPIARSDTRIQNMLLKIALPIALTGVMFNFSNMIDAIVIQNRLAHLVLVHGDYIKTRYANELLMSGTLDSDIKDFFYGAYALSLDFRNLIPSLTMALGVSAIPELASAYVKRNRRAIKNNVETVLRTSMIIAIPAGFGIAAVAKPILRLFYEGGSSEGAISIAAPIMAYYGVTMLLISISQPLINMNQAINLEKIPLVSLMIGSFVKIIIDAILISIPQINVLGAAFGNTICFTIVVIINYIVLIKKTRIKINYFSVFIKPLIGAAFSGVSAKLTYDIVDLILPEWKVGAKSLTNIIALIFSIVIAIFVYFTVMFFIHGFNKSDIFSLPKGDKVLKVLENKGLI